MPLLFQSLEEIQNLKKAVKALTEKVSDLEGRVQALETKKS